MAKFGAFLLSLGMLESSSKSSKLDSNTYQGFSLVEIMIVLVIVGVVGAVGWSLLAQTSSQMKDKTDAAKLEDCIKRARIASYGGKFTTCLSLSNPGSGYECKATQISGTRCDDDAISAGSSTTVGLPNVSGIATTCDNMILTPNGEMVCGDANPDAKGRGGFAGGGAAQGAVHIGLTYTSGGSAEMDVYATGQVE